MACPIWWQPGRHPIFGNKMVKIAAFAMILATVVACDRDETLRSYGASDKTWRLTELDGQPFDQTATITFSQKDRIVGQGPCNSYTANMSVPYPWFKAEALISTKMACPALTDETRFFNALGQATISEVLAGTMILSNTDGLKMVFTASD
jgi:heat shock protein HslJ